MDGVVFDPLLGALRTKDDTGGGGSGGTCANSPQLLCLGGRTGTTNDPLLSTDGDGTLTGSGVQDGALVLNPNTSASITTAGYALQIATVQTNIASPGDYVLISAEETARSFDAVGAALIGIEIGGTWSLNGGGIGAFGHFRAESFGPTLQITSGDTQTVQEVVGYRVTPNVTVQGGAVTINSVGGLLYAPQFAALAGGTLDLGFAADLDIAPFFNGAVHAPNITGLLYEPAITGGATIDQAIAVDIVNLGFAADPISLRSVGPTTKLLHTGPVRVGDASNAALLRLADAAGHDTILTTQPQAGDITYALPASDAAGQLTSDGLGTLSWTAGTGGGSTFMGMLGLDGDEGPEGMPIPGSPGTPGAAGATGDIGPQGMPGIGLDGVDGDDGLLVRGDQGIQGPTGAQGPPGFPIIEDPLDGEMGPPGLIGAQGMQGVTGPQGLDGEVGDDGMPIPGNQGTPGAQGPQGIPGIGLDGDVGDDGLMIQGNQGSPGATGPQGIPGIGLDGEEGPEGLMIQGTQGVPGATGAQGIPGIGLDGSDGDDGLLIQGSQGIQGPTGAQGPAGVPWTEDFPGIEADLPCGFSLNRRPSLDWLNLVTDPTGTGAWVFGTSPTFTTDLRTPLIYGGTGASGTLQLQSTTNATRGTVNLVDQGLLWTGLSTLSSAQNALNFNNTLTLDNNGSSLTLIAANGTWTATASFLNAHALLQAGATLTNSGTATLIPGLSMLNNVATISAAVSGTTHLGVGYVDGPTFNATGGGTWAAAHPAYTGIRLGMTATTAIGATSSYTGINVQANSGAGTWGTHVALNVGALTGTTSAAVQSAITAASTRFFLNDTGGAQSKLTGKFTTYNNITTAGFGVSTVVAAARSTAQTAAVASVATFTPGADGTFLVSANVLVTTATAHTFTVTVSYKDEGNTSRTLTLTFSNVGGTLLTAITNAGGAVPYEGVPLHIRAKSGTAITIATTGTFTTVTYNVDGLIVQVA